MADADPITDEDIAGLEQLGACPVHDGTYCPFENLELWGPHYVDAVTTARSHRFEAGTDVTPLPKHAA